MSIDMFAQMLVTLTGGLQWIKFLKSCNTLISSVTNGSSWKEIINTIWKNEENQKQQIE